MNHDNADTTREATPGKKAGRLTRPATVLAALTVATAGVFAATTTDAFASYKGIHVGKTSTHIRDCYHPSKQSYPSTNCKDQGTVSAGTQVYLSCQYQGENKSGDVWWDYVHTPNNGDGYMSDFYLDTGTSSYRVPGVDLCSY